MKLFLNGISFMNKFQLLI